MNPPAILQYLDEAVRSVKRGEDPDTSLRIMGYYAEEMGFDVNSIRDIVRQAARTSAAASSNSISSSINFPEARVSPDAVATGVGKLPANDANGVFFPTEAEKDLLLRGLVGIWTQEQVASSLGPTVELERYMSYSGFLGADPNAPSSDGVVFLVDGDALASHVKSDFLSYLGKIEAGVRGSSDFFSSKDKFKLRLKSLVASCIDQALKSGRAKKVICTSCSFNQYAGINAKAGFFELRVEMQCYK